MGDPTTVGLTGAPTISATSASTSFSGWPASNLFDGVVGASGNSWSASADYPAWVQVQYVQTFTIASYDIVARTDNNIQCPSAWTLDGSNDGSTWTTLDTRSGQSFSNGQSRTYTVSGSPAAYSYYRLNISAVPGGGGASDNWPSFTEWRLTFTAGVSTLADWYKADAITGVSNGASVASSNIVDSSGNGHTFSSGSTSAVLRVGTGPNGRSWVDHTSGGYFGSSTATQPVPSGDLTYFGIIKATSSSIQSLLGSVSSGGAQLRLNAFKLELDRDGVASVGTSTLTFTSGVFAPFLVTYTKSSGSMKIRIGASTQTISGASGASFSSPGSQRNLMSYRGGSSNIFSGGWVEIGRFTSVLSNPDEAVLWDYLSPSSQPPPPVRLVNRAALIRASNY